MVADGRNVDGKVLGGIVITSDDAQGGGFQFLAWICHEVDSGGLCLEVMQRKQQQKG
jgi:hypothetical protein